MASDDISAASSTTTVTQDNIDPEKGNEKDVQPPRQEDATSVEDLNFSNANHDLEIQSDPSSKAGETLKSERPYSAFTSRQKFTIILAASLAACFSPFTTNIYFPLIDVISKALKVSVTDVNLSVTTYMIVQGVAPSIISAISDQYGRRLAYLVGLVVYLGANLGLALDDNYAGLLVLRCIQAAGSSGMVTLSQGTVADVVTSAERGKYISITAVPAILAPSVAPIIGGLLGAHLGWHSVFWFLLILGAVYLIPMTLFFPETNRRIVGDGSIRPPKWNRTVPDVIRNRTRQDIDTECVDPPTRNNQFLPKKRFNPFAPLTMITEPSTFWLLFTTGIVYSSFYAVSTSLTVQFHTTYNLSTTLQGLLFIPQAIGTIVATITNTRLIDRSFARYAKRAEIPVDKKRQLDILSTPLHIERARLDIATPMLFISGILTIIYGWLVQARVNIWAPLVLLVLMGFTTLSSFTTINVLIIDLHRDKPATASAANNLVRCLMGAGSAAVVNAIIDSVGFGWCFTIWGVAVSVLATPMLVGVCIWGPRWRETRVRLREEKGKGKA